MPLKVSRVNVLMHALAYIYDHLAECPVWLRRLTPGQLENIAKLMVSWHAGRNSSCEIEPLEKVEKQAILRAISLSGGDVVKAAKALGIGKTTLYRKVKQWAYSSETRVLIHKASALAEAPVKNCQDQDDGTETDSRPNPAAS